MFKGKLGAMLYVNDLKHAVEFYREKLGFGFKGYWDNEAHKVEMDWDKAGKPGYAEVTVGDNGIGLHAAETQRVAGGAVVLHIEVDDVDSYHARLVQAGVTATAPGDEPWGARMFTAKDPDGHEWSFLQITKRPEH